MIKRKLNLKNIGNLETQIFKNYAGFIINNSNIKLKPDSIYYQVMDQLQDYFLEQDLFLKIRPHSEKNYSALYSLNYDIKDFTKTIETENILQKTKIFGSIGYVNKHKESWKELYHDKHFFYFNSKKYEKEMFKHANDFFFNKLLKQK